MSVYESISRASLKAKQRLFDYNVSILGQKMKAIRISYKEDMFQDIEINDAISTEVLEAVIRFPTEMPLERYRLGFNAEVGETRTYFYELLPIESYTKLSDNIEKNDFLFLFLQDEKGNQIPYLFQVTDSFGKFEIGLVWKKQYLAPYHGQLTNQIIRYLEDYVIHGAYDSYKAENPDSTYLSTAEEIDNYVSDNFINLYPSSLNPKDISIRLKEGTYVAQCAFGSFSLLDQTVLPMSPVKFTLAEDFTVDIVVSDDCRFPSIYFSEYLHPYAYDKKQLFYISKSLVIGEYILKIHVDLLDEHNYGYVLYLPDGQGENLEEYSEDYIPIYFTSEEDESRPLIYIENEQGYFIQIKMSRTKEIVLTYKTGEDTTINNLGTYTEDMIDIKLAVSVDEISISCLGNENIITNLFLNRTIYIGYEPERYLNDFIYQIYS